MLVTPMRSLGKPTSVRLRLTTVYGSLFLVSGAALLTLTYLLVRQLGRSTESSARALDQAERLLESFLSLARSQHGAVDDHTSRVPGRDRRGGASRAP